MNTDPQNIVERSTILQKISYKTFKNVFRRFKKKNYRLRFTKLITKKHRIFLEEWLKSKKHKRFTQAEFIKFFKTSWIISVLNRLFPRFNLKSKFYLFLDSFTEHNYNSEKMDLVERELKNARKVLFIEKFLKGVDKLDGGYDIHESFMDPRSKIQDPSLISLSEFIDEIEVNIIEDIVDLKNIELYCINRSKETLVKSRS